MTVLLQKGKEGLIDGTLDMDTDTIKIALLDLDGHTDTGVKAITGATNATPIVITATSHGFSNGDYVYIDGVGGNLSANGIYKIANVAANTFELQRLDGTNVAGTAAYTSGGYAVCLGPSASGDNWDDFDGCLIGTATALASRTVTSGVFDAADTTITAVSGNSVEAAAIFEDTGTPSTSRVLQLVTGKHNVTVAADAASSATTIWVEPLAEAIANGTTLTFSNGKQATLSAGASAGDRSLTVSALANAITAGNQTLAPKTSSGFPVTPNGGDITINYSNGNYKIFGI